MSFPTEQSVYHITNFTGYKDIKRIQEPLSTKLDKDDVLIKIKAVSLNYRDLLISKNASLLQTKPNVIPCSDASGEVVKVGSGVTDLAVGDRVVTNFDPEHQYGAVPTSRDPYGCNRDGVLTQYKVISKYSVNKLPGDSHLTDEEAASLVCTGVTAWNALFGAAESFTPGQTVLMLGTGGVSITALVLAKAAGAITIITSSSDEKLKYVRERYGVDYTINYRTHPEWEKQVQKITGGRGVDVVIETGGNGTIAQSIASVRMGGQIAVIGILSQPKEKPDMLMGVLSKALTVRGVLVGSKQLAEQLIRFIHAKEIRMPVEKVLGYSEQEVHEAYGLIQNATQIGKIVIKVD